jgi:hypothetical protein
MADEKQIALFKLFTGEEVIAEYKNDGEFYVLKQPRKVFLAQMPDRTYGVKMMPWIIGNPDGVFPVHSGHVVTVSPTPTEQLLNGYLSETSGLDLSAAAPKTIVGA